MQVGNFTGLGHGFRTSAKSATLKHRPTFGAMAESGFLLHQHAALEQRTGFAISADAQSCCSVGAKPRIQAKLSQH